MFDINDYKDVSDEPVADGRLDRQYKRVLESGKETQQISTAVDGAIRNIESAKARSFVIYGEPQSGKTEMMICLTAALLDRGLKQIIILTNDSVQLLDQNLRRFQKSGLDPAPKAFTSILDPAVTIGSRSWIIFCKKNSSDLQKLNDKLGKSDERIVIDDEADYASPNGKVNRAAKTTINALVEELIGGGVYVGVTATPARLDLNTTFDNDSERWVDFPAHSAYTGQDVFFPTTQNKLDSLDYRLVLMPAQWDSGNYLRAALLSFIANVAYLNQSGIRPDNYSMLIHTSGKKVDHTEDYRAVVQIFEVLSDPSSSLYAQYVKDLYERASERDEATAREVTRYAIRKISQNNIIVMNSEKASNQASYQNATNPTTMFTVAIGGNIVSRGVTFDNLLSMFFTRDTQHKLQQDTYIQRARMFGSRSNYLKWFELFIPESLYHDWQRCFVFHQLSLANIRKGDGAPIWLGDNRIQAAATPSIRTAAVHIESGEMFWDKFILSDELRSFCSVGRAGVKNLEELLTLVGQEYLPEHLVQFIKHLLPYGDESVVVHPITVLGDRYKSAEVDDITRDKGLIASNLLERAKFPRAMHHLKIFTNNSGNARLYYKYVPDPTDFRVNSKRITFMARSR